MIDFQESMQRNHRQRRLPRLLLALLVAGLIAATWPAASFAQESAPGYRYEECGDIAEATLRDDLNRLSQSVFSSGRSELNVAAIVDREWQTLGLDTTIDTEVERAVTRLYSEESYWSRFVSGWSAEKAQEFAGEVAGDAFGSETFHSQINRLSVAVSNQIASELAIVSAHSASSGLLCVQSFIDDSYSKTMAELFESELQGEVSKSDFGAVDTTVNPLLQSHTRSLAGIGVIIGSQIAKRLAQRIAERIAGRIVTRVLGRAATAAIPIAGWVIGGGLIVWDLIEGGRGALPQIQEALQGASVKAGIRAEIATSVEDELRKEYPDIARTIANEVYSAWLDFQQKYTNLLKLAEENETFRLIVDDATPQEVGRLANLVDIAEQAMGRRGLDAAIADGTLARIFELPQDAYQILRTTANPELVLAWSDLAGATLSEVVSTELYKVATPADFTSREDLEVILALENPEAVLELMLLNQADRALLLNLPHGNVAQLSAVFSPQQLRWLAGYLSELQPRERSLLVDRLLRDPELMAMLQNEPVRQAVVESQHVEETLEFLSADDQGAEQTAVEQIGKVIKDTERLFEGQVSWILFWRKYGTWRNVLLLLAGAVALTLAARLTWRRAQPVNVIVTLPERTGEPR